MARRTWTHTAALVTATALIGGCAGDGGTSPWRALRSASDDPAAERTVTPRPEPRLGRHATFMRRVSTACGTERRRLATLRSDLRVASRLGRERSRAVRASADRDRVQRALSRLLRAVGAASRRLADLDPPPGVLRERTRAYLNARHDLESALELYRSAVEVGEVDAYPELERERSLLTSRARRLANRAGLRRCAAV